MSAKKVFPPYLDQGSKGPAVNVLALLMIAWGCGNRVAIVLDGDYTPGGEIVKAVMEFQEHVGFKGADVDGNFGPKTRAKYLEDMGIDPDSFTTDMFTGEGLYVGPNGQSPLPLDGTHEWDREPPLTRKVRLAADQG